MKEILLKTARLVLRPLGTGDLTAAARNAMDAENTKYMVFLPDESLEEVALFLQAVEDA